MPTLHDRTRPASGAAGVTLPHSPISYYARCVETINGKPVTEDMIQAWADEAKRGYDIEQLRKRGRKPNGDGPARVVPVRIDDTLLSAIEARAQREGTNRSAVIRDILRAHVA